MTVFSPSSAAETLQTIQWAVSEEASLEIRGHGSKAAIGRPQQTEHVIDLSAITGVTLYEPEELVLSARAGTPLATLEQMLAERGQQFAFEPMDYGPLLGAKRGRGTIGGVLACNLSGPRRLKSGAARDHILGVQAVSGRGEAFKAGGRVVKNVTGYDLSKAMANSWGTLAVVTDVTFKVLPAAETEVTMVLRNLLDEEATNVMALALGSSAEISSAAHLPEGVANLVGGNLGSSPATLLRLEGFGPSVAYRSESLKKLLGNLGELETLGVETSRLIWADIRDCIPFADGRDAPVWRISVAPSQAHAITLAFRREAPATCFYDWQGGLVWLRTEDGEPHAEKLRALIDANGGGHATLVRANPSIRSSIPVFHPQPAALAGLAQRFKEQFDPRRILSPGRLG